MKHFKRVALVLLSLPIFVVAVALSNRTSERTHRLEDLEYALHSEDADVRLGAIAALTEYGEDAVPILATGLDDKDPEVKRVTIVALGRIGGQKASAALSETLSDTDKRMRIWGILALGSAGRSSLPHLFKALETEPTPRARMFVAHSIGRVVGPGDAGPILERFDEQDAATKMHLVIALVKIGDNEALEGLRRLIDSPDRLVRFYVVNTLADSPNPNKKATPILIDSLDDEAEEVRMWGLFCLQRINPPECYPAVVERLGDENPHVRKEAAYLLGNLANPDAVPHLIARLDDSHYLVRGDAAHSLGKLGDPRAIAVLKPLLAERYPSVQIQAADALARLKDYRGIETLIGFVDSPELLYRVEAQRRLQSLSNKNFGDDRHAWLQWWANTKSNPTESIQAE